MKRLLLSVALVVAVAFTAQAQKGPKNALGLRFGGNNGLGTEISYQRDLSKNNRLELDLGWRNNDHYDAVKVTGLYEWVWNIEGGFDWYAGVGAAVGTWNSSYYDHKHSKHSDSGAFGLITGTVGVEYNFKEVPIQVALDLRPEVYLNDSYRNGIYADLGIAVRYRF